MGDRDDHKSKQRYEKSRKQRRYDDDDDYKRRDRYEYHAPKKGLLERLLTPGQTANNLIKTAATGMIAGGTILLMGVYGIFGESIAGSSSYLPMATAVTSAVATACVWIFGRPKTEESHNAEFSAVKKELANLRDNLENLQVENADLAQRLATVEMLESFEDRLAKRTLDKQIQSKSSASAATLSSDMPVHNTPEALPSSSSARVQEKE